MLLSAGFEEQPSVHNAMNIELCGYVTVFKYLQRCGCHGNTERFKRAAIKEHHKNLQCVCVCVCMCAYMCVCVHKEILIQEP